MSIRASYQRSFNVYLTFYWFRNEIFRRPHACIKARVSVLLARKSSRIRVVTSVFSSVLTFGTNGTAT